MSLAVRNIFRKTNISYPIGVKLMTPTNLLTLNDESSFSLWLTRVTNLKKESLHNLVYDLDNALIIQKTLQNFKNCTTLELFRNLSQILNTENFSQVVSEFNPEI